MFPSLLITALLLVVLLLSLKCFLYSKRIYEISRVIKSMAEGNFSSRMLLSPSDKLGELARHLNELSLGIQKRLEDAIYEKEKLEAILASMAEGVVVISPDAHLMHLNPSFLSMFEVRSLDWQGKYYWEIIANQTINESIREAIEYKKVLRKDISIVHPNEVFFDILISPVVNSSGRLISLVAVFHDVTELKKYESLRTEFVANVSHELKTPLTSIKGFVETLQAGAIHDKANALRFLDIMSKQALRLENLVNDLLVISSLESKDVKMDFIESDIFSVIQSVVLMKKKSMEEFGHTLTLSLPSHLPLVLMDSQRMEQVFLNLLDNAIKYTPSGGQIQIKAFVDGQYLRVDVIDSGSGISAEHLSRVFERFWRADKSRNQESGGTGLGLSIVKHIVDIHKGKVEVESVLGCGARFSVFLPLDVI